MENPFPMNFDMPVGGTVAYRQEDGRVAVYLVVACAPELVVVMEIGDVILSSGSVRSSHFRPRRPPTRSRTWKIWTPSFYAPLLKVGMLERISVQYIPDEMARTPVRSDEDPMIHTRRSVVAYLERNWEMQMLTDKKTYAHAIHVGSHQCGQSRETVRSWFEKHLFYGRHANALMTRHWDKGRRILRLR